MSYFKKLVSILVLAAFAAGTVFAAPAGASAQIAAVTDQTDVALATESSNVAQAATVVDDDLFSDIQSEELSAEAAEAVEGEGVVLATLAAAVISRAQLGARVEQAVYAAQSKSGSGFSETRAKINAVSAGILVEAAIVLIAGCVGPQARIYVTV